MARVNVCNSDGKLIGWFDDTAITEQYDEKTYFDGRNYRSINTDSQWEHQELIRTGEERWVLHRTSPWQHKQSRWEFVSDLDAKCWLLQNGYDRDYERYFGPLPSEQGPSKS